MTLCRRPGSRPVKSARKESLRTYARMPSTLPSRASRMSFAVSTRKQPLRLVISRGLARASRGKNFDIVANNDNRRAWLPLHPHALFPLTIMPICVSKYSPALSFFQCFRHDLGNLAGEVRQRVVVDHGRVHGRVPAVFLNLAWVLDPFEPGRDRRVPEAVRSRAHLDLGTERANHPVDPIGLQAAQALVGVMEIDEQRPRLPAAVP